LKLILEDGTILEGGGVGFEGNVAGEVVFNTGMSGYAYADLSFLSRPDARSHVSAH